MEENVIGKEGQPNSSQKDVNRENLRIKTTVKMSRISNTKKTFKVSRIPRIKNKAIELTHFPEDGASEQCEKPLILVCY